MKTTRLLALAALTLAAPAAAQVKLNGAGATFPNIIYQDWMLSYNKTHPDVQLNYQSIGSGGGIRQFSDGTVDFGGSDAPITDYLSKVSPEWRSKVGKGTSVNWPVGLGGKGNEGVAATVNQTPGGIGYIELAYATSNKMSFGQVRNSSGKFVTPSLESVTAALAGVLKTLPPTTDFRISITNPDGADAYPIE